LENGLTQPKAKIEPKIRENKKSGSIYTEESAAQSQSSHEITEKGLKTRAKVSSLLGKNHRGRKYLCKLNF